MSHAMFKIMIVKLLFVLVLNLDQKRLLDVFGMDCGFGSNLSALKKGLALAN